MKAVDFIKKFGWADAKTVVNVSRQGINAGVIDINDLKQYVDAYELVQKRGGLTKCQFIVVDPLIMWDTSDIKQAIALVEEMENENQD